MRLLDIPLSQAFSFCFHQPSYVGWLIGATLLAIGVAVVAVKQYNRTQEAWWGTVGVAIPIIILVCALLIRPCSVAANTSPEQAQRGVFIG